MVFLIFTLLLLIPEPLAGEDHTVFIISYFRSYVQHECVYEHHIGYTDIYGIETMSDNPGNSVLENVRKLLGLFKTSYVGTEANLPICFIKCAVSARF